MTLATFLHISDLHFGVIDPETFDAQAHQIWATLPTFEGFLGHRYSSLVLLERLFGITLNGESPLLIVTGDITSNGNDEQFRIAHDYLGNELIMPDNSAIGLGCTDWKDWAIPGNHDHWPGSNWILGSPSQTFQNGFRGFPAVADLTLSTGDTIRFLRIDSDSDVSCYFLDRFFARGSFPSQLDALRELTKSLEAASVTILCLHHSPAEGGYLRALDRKSRRALDKFIIDMEISVLMTGHIHNPPLVKAFTATDGARSRRYIEARCGTTTQSDFFESPYYWKTYLAPFDIKPKRWSNSLLVHRIVDRNGSLYWETELLQQRVQDFLPPQSPLRTILVDPSFKLR